MPEDIKGVFGKAEMRIILEIKENPYNLMRKCGYHSEGIDKKTGQTVFARRLGVGDYPRFHAYVSREKQEINLHLDQKKPVYKSQPAHAAEYEGELVEKEAERIKKIFRGR